MQLNPLKSLCQQINDSHYCFNNNNNDTRIYIAPHGSNSRLSRQLQYFQGPVQSLHL